MEDQNNSTKISNTTFSMLPLEIKVKIFSMLSIGSRYNASFVWEEMSEEIWRTIPREKEFTRKFEDIKTLSFDIGERTVTSWSISNLDDLEKVGVLATSEHLDSVDRLELSSVDVSNVPSNILNGLAKIIGEELYLKNVRVSMLKIAKELRHLSFKNMSQKTTNQDSVIEDESLLKSFGDICELLDSIACDKLEIAYLKLKTNETTSLTKFIRKQVRSLECWGLTRDELIWIRNEF